MKYCLDCEKLVEEGLRDESFTGEAWGSKFIHTDTIPCCCECRGTDIEKAEKCPCGEEIEPLAKNKWGLCENCRDNLDDELSEIRKIFRSKLLAEDQSTVETYIIDNLWNGYDESLIKKIWGK